MLGRLRNVIFELMPEQKSGKKLLSDRRELFISLRRLIKSKAVLKAMERVPRELFVPSDERPNAYLDIPLPIGEGQRVESSPSS